jgi:hypothetical protein
VRATASYEPRDPAQSILFQVVSDHFETFRQQAVSVRDGKGLPRFVERKCATGLYSRATSPTPAHSPCL